jgi:hypothetical protein
VSHERVIHSPPTNPHKLNKGAKFLFSPVRQKEIAFDGRPFAFLIDPMRGRWQQEGIFGNPLAEKH